MVDGHAKVLVVSEDETFRNALGRVLNGEYQIETTSNLPTSDPNADIIVWQPGGSAWPIQASIEALACPTLVVGPTDPEAMISAVEARAVGFVTEDATVDEVVQAIDVVLEGGAVIPPTLLGTLLRHLVEKRRRTEEPNSLSELTSRELEVFRLAANGNARQQIAERLFISPNTVRTHLQRVYRKLGIHSRSELVALAARAGYLENPEGE